MIRPMIALFALSIPTAFAVDPTTYNVRGTGSSSWGPDYACEDGFRNARDTANAECRGRDATSFVSTFIEGSRNWTKDASGYACSVRATYTCY